ncbi:MAG: peptidylprolyl isomerase [Thermoplasmatales archaeon]|nr:peptidylprolyl isomerase [Thermoplasmatales archaeon]
MEEPVPSTPQVQYPQPQVVPKPEGMSTIRRVMVIVIAVVIAVVIVLSSIGYIWYSGYISPSEETPTLSYTTSEYVGGTIISIGSTSKSVPLQDIKCQIFIDNSILVSEDLMNIYTNKLALDTVNYYHIRLIYKPTGGTITEINPMSSFRAVTFQDNDSNGLLSAGDMFILKTTAYGVELSCDEREKTVAPGSSTTYIIIVKNTGVYQDTVTLTKWAPSGWSATLSQPSIILSADETQTITLSVIAPLASPAYNWSIIVTGKSSGDPNVQSSVTLIANMESTYGVELSCTENEKTVWPGDTVNYTINVKNTGTVEDTVLLSTGVSGNGTWTPKTSIPAERGISSAATVDGKIFMIGGSEPKSGAIETDRIDVYYPTSDSWVIDGAPKMPAIRTHLSRNAPVIGDRLYVVGGWNGYSPQSTNFVYNITTNTWSTDMSMPMALYGMQQTTYNGKMYSFGGDYGGYGGHEQSVTYEYTPSLSGSGSWTTKASMPTPRNDMAVVTFNNKIYVIGGETSGNTPTNAVEVYDPVSNTWETKSSLPFAEGYASGWVLENVLYILGGSNKTYRYDTSADTWTVIGNLPVESNSFGEHGATVFNNYAYVFWGNWDSAWTYQFYSPEGYPNEEKQEITATLNDVYSEQTVDSDGDGHYDYLKISVGINVSEDGNYSVDGLLYIDNNTIYTSKTAYLYSGKGTITLSFNGLDIYLCRANGSYQLRDLTLRLIKGNTSFRLDYKDYAYNTSLYNYTSFQSSTRVEYTSSKSVGIGWSISLSKSSVSLDAGESTAVTLTVPVPANASAGNYTITVLGKSQGDPTRQSTITLTANVLPVEQPYILEAIINVNKNVVFPNEVITFDASQSRGDIVEYYWDFNLLDGIEWVLGDQVVTWSYADIGTYKAALKVVDKEGDTSTDAIFIYVMAGADYGVNLICLNNTKAVSPGEKITYVATLTNIGNYTDTLYLIPSNVPVGWSVVITPFSKTLTSGGYTTVNITVKAPADAVENESISITLTSQSYSDESVYDTVIITAVVSTSVLPELEGITLYFDEKTNGVEINVITFPKEAYFGTATISVVHNGSSVYDGFMDVMDGEGRKTIPFTDFVIDNGVYTFEVTFKGKTGTVNYTINGVVTQIDVYASASLDGTQPKIDVEVWPDAATPLGEAVVTITQVGGDVIVDAEALTFSETTGTYSGTFPYVNSGNYTIYITLANPVKPESPYKEITGYVKNGTGGDNVFVNLGPVAVIWPSSQTVYLSVNNTAEFSGNNSVDYDGAIVNWTWVFDTDNDVDGDDDVLYGMTVTYEYDSGDVGSHTVTLCVLDNSGMFAVITCSVNVQETEINQRPTAVISSPSNNAEFTTKDNIFFDAAGSYDPDNDSLFYIWVSSIDGNIGNTKSFSRELSQGTHTITLTVDDGNGGVDTVQTTLIVQNITSDSTNRISTIETSMGTIKIRLYEDKAPITTANFISLAESGFYNGTIFHRVIDDFVIQGGGFYPNLTQKMPIYPPINLEINAELTHVDGAVAMARTSEPNSATSQFYICDGPQHQLDGSYAVFGQVIEGMDVVRAIASVETHTENGMNDVPVEDVIIIGITISEFTQLVTGSFEDPATGTTVTVQYTGTGTINITSVEPPGTAPSGKESLGKFIEVTASETLSINWFYIGIPYTESDIPSGVDESTLRMYYWTGTEWEICDNTGVDVVSNIVWANITHITVFAPMFMFVNQAPTASFTASETEVEEGVEIEFTSTSTDPDNDALIYSWTSSIDGNIGGTPSFSRKLSKGTHTITLTVDDGHGGTDTKQITIVVNKPSEPSGFIPGFETAMIIVMMGACVTLLKKKRREKG